MKPQDHANGSYHGDDACPHGGHPDECRAMKDVDALVDILFKLQDEVEPDTDPGDLTIHVQDDIPMAEVTQTGRNEVYRANTIREALLGAIGRWETKRQRLR